MARRIWSCTRLGVMLSLFGAAPAVAASAPPTALSITSDRLEMDDKSQVAIFLGHVVADNGRMRLSANRMTVHYDKKRKSGSGGVREVKAEGQVVIQEDKNKGKADSVNYQLEKRTLELVGKESDASVQRGDDVLTGRRILVTLDNEQRIGKVMVQGSESNRVSARITPSGLLQRVESPLRGGETQSPAKTPEPQKEAAKPAETATGSPTPPQAVQTPDGRSRISFAATPEKSPESREPAPQSAPTPGSEVDPKETVAGLKETVAGWKETVAGWKENAPASEAEGVEGGSRGSATPTPKPRRRVPSGGASKR
ncbi:MAG: hypothetical protein HQM02_01960 [Magnetococcales bacterium]|nr:hypothetical protein [Magnetococcales bacterium]